MYSSLLSFYPENGLELARRFDYWRCRELIDIASSGKINPEDKLQIEENDKFNLFLDSISYRKYEWEHIPQKLNLWQIHKKSNDTSNFDEQQVT